MGSQVNWRRGAIRMWAVVSLIWVGIVAVGLPAEIRAVYENELIWDGAQGISIPANTTPDAVQKAFVRYFKNKNAESHTSGDSQAQAAELARQFHYRSLWLVILSRFVGPALALPLGLLAAGLAGWWIAQGFRRA